MRTLNGWILAAMASVLAAVTTASADECMLSCAGGKKVCITEARTALRSCKEACKAAPSPGCWSACADRVSAAMGSCKAAILGCRTNCPLPSDPPFPCAVGCGTAGRYCFKSLLVDGKACVTRCLAAGGTGLRECLLDCAGDLHDGGAACYSGVQSCREDCVPPPPPVAGPPGCVAGCFADARPCFDAAQPTVLACANSCREAGWNGFFTCLRSCTAGACACLADLRSCVAGCGGSAGGAFVAPPTGIVCGSPSGAFIETDAPVGQTP